MKKFFSVFLFVASIIGFAVSSSAQPFVYSQNFVIGATPTTQCSAWTTYCASLPSANISYFNIASSITTTSYTCTSAAAAQAVANAMRTAAVTTQSSDGHTWFVGTGCGSGCSGLGGAIVELAVDQGTCACGTTATVRPAINNSNWGGFGTTCTANTQTLTVSFTTGVWYSSTGGGDASNMANWWSNSNNTGFHPPSTINNANDVWVFQGPMTCTANPFTIAGSVLINSGATFTPVASSTVNIGRSFTNNGTFNNNSSTVVLNGTAAQTVSGSSTTQFNNLTLSNSSFPVTLASNINISNLLTVNSGSVLSPISTAVINSAATAGTITGSGTVEATNVSGSADYATQYKFISNALTAMTVDYAGSGAQTINSTVGTYGSLKTSNGGTKTLQSSVTVNNDVTIGSGTTLDVSASNFQLTLSGNWAQNGSFAARSGLVLFNGGASKTLTGFMTGTNKFNSLQFTGGGSWSFGANAADVGSTFTISSGTVTAPSTTLQLAGSYSNSGTFTHNGGTVNFNATTGTFSISGNMTSTNRFNILNFNGVGGSWSFGSAAEAASNFTLTNGNIVQGPSTFTVGGNFSINGGTFTSFFSGTINVAGSWFNAGVFSHNNGTVNMNGTTAGLSMGGNMTSGTNGRFFNLTFNGSSPATWSFGSNPADVAGTFTTSGTGNVTAPSSTLTISGNWSDSGPGLFIHNNGTVVFNGNSSISGLMTGTSKFNNISFTGCGSYTFVNNADFAGNFTNTCGTVTTPVSSTFNIAGSMSNSSTFSPGASSNIFVGTNWVNNATFNAGSSTVTMNGTAGGLVVSGSLTSTNRFNILTFNGVGGSWTINNNLDAASNFTITNGTVTTPSSHLMSVLGNFTNSGSFVAGASSTINLGSAGTGNWNATGGSFSASTSTLNMNGSGAISLSGNMTGANKFNNLSFFNAAGSFSFAGNADVGGNFLLNSGVLTTPTSHILNITGNMTNNNTFNAGALSSINLAGNWINNSVFTASSSTVTMNAAGVARTLSGNMTAATNGKFNNLIFNGLGGSWSFSNSIDAVNLTITQGTLTAPGSAFTFQVTGNWSNNTGTFIHNSGTVIMNSGSGGLTLTGAMTGTNKFNNLQFTGGGAWTFGANAADVAGNLTISSGTVTAPSTTLQIAGAYSNSGAFTHNSGIVNFNATTGTFSVSGNMTGTNRFNNLFFNGSGGSWSFASAAEAANNFTLTLGTITQGPSTFTVGNNFSINGGTFTSFSSGTINVAGSWFNGSVFNHNNSTVNMNGATAGLSMSGNMTAATNGRFFNLTFSGSAPATWTFGATPAEVASAFSITGTGGVTAPSTTLTVTGNWNHSGTGLYSHNNGTVIFNGSSSISGNLTGTSKFNHVTFNGCGTYTFVNNADLNGNFTNTCGTVTTPASSVLNITGTMSNSSTFSPGASTAINVSTNWANPGTFNASTSTVTMNGVSSGLTLSGNMTGTNRFNLLVFNGSGGGWTMSNNVDVFSNMTITAGTVTTPASHILNIGTNGNGSFSNAGGFVAGTTSAINVTSSWNATGGAFNASTSTVTMNGNNSGQTFAGNMTGVNKFNNLTFSGSSPAAWTFNAVPADIGGNFLISGNGAVTTPTTTLNISGNMNNSGTLNAGAAGIINLGSNVAGTGNWTNSNIFNASTGTVNMISNVASSLSGTLSGVNGRFNNLTFNGTGGTFTINSNADVNNNTNSNFTIIAGTVTTPSSHILNIAGNWSNAGTYNAGASSTINVAGTTGTNAWNNNGTFSASTSTVNFNSAISGTRTLLGAMTGTNKFYNITFSGTSSSAIYTFGVTPADVANNFTISGANTVTAPSTTLQIAGNYNNAAGIFAHNGGTVNMNGTAGGLTLSGSMTLSGSSRFNNLTFNGTGSWGFNSNAETANNFTISSGTVTGPSTGTLTIGGNWFNGSSFNHNNSTVVMTGSAAGLTLGGNLTGSSSFYNLTFSGSGSWSFLVPSATAVNNFIQTSGTLTAPSSTFTIGGGWSHTGGTFNHNNATVAMNGTSAGPFTITSILTGSNSFYNLIFSTAIPTTVWNFGANVQTVNNFSITGGKVVGPSSGTITIGGNYANTATFTHNNSTVLMNGTVTGLTLSGNMTAAASTSPFYILTFNGVGGNWSFNSTPADVQNNFTITNGTVTAPSSTLQVAGNWQNSGTFNHNSGLVSLNGTSLQTLTGATTFNNLQFNNTANFSLNSDETVNGQLTMSAGRVTIGSNNLIMGAVAPAITGLFSSSIMIVANSTGQVRKQMNSIGSYFFPVGDNSPNYSPISLNFTGGSFNPGAYYGVNLKTVKHPNNANVNNFLNRYWSVATSNITSPVYAVTSATYVAADVTGTEASMSGGQFSGALPWLKFAAVNTATHTFSTTPVTSNNSDFTAITTQAPVITSSPGVAICNGSATLITTSGAAGDPSLSYVWAPASSLSASFGTAVVATPSVTTTYTVTLTDGNGFTGTSTTTIVVNPLPATITGATSICTGFTSALASSPFTGTWTSSNTFLAVVTPSGGVVSALSSGTAVITYTLPTGCYVTTSVTLLQSPAGITGVTNVCTGSATTLSSATPGGVWTSGSPVVASVGSGSGIVTGINAGTPVITYRLPSNGCYVTTTVTVNAIPLLYTVSGGGSYCAGSAGMHVGLSNSQVGVNYNLYRGSSIAGVMPGTGFPLDFGALTAAGTYSVSAVNSTTGCNRNMTGSATISINLLPLPFAMSAGGGYCDLGAGIDVTLGGSAAGILYQLYDDGVLIPGALHLGTGGVIDYGFQTLAGAYTVIAQDPSTGCSSNMTGASVVVVNPNPNLFTVTGGGGYCTGGTGVHIGVNYSNTGINYQLLNSGVAVGAPVAGASSAIDFGLQTGSGTYTVDATNSITGCVSTMTGTATVTINLPPVAYDVNGGGNYCAGGTGRLVGMNNTDPGIKYQLYLGALRVGAPVAGTGTNIDFGMQTANGAYTVVATDTATGCTSNMTGSVAVTIDPLPTAYIVGGGGRYCNGTAGTHVTLSNSDIGTNYQLYYGSTPLGGLVPGLDTLLDFGLQVGIGTYSVAATNSATGCTGGMAGSVAITVDPLPNAYIVTGGGAFCATGAGVHIGLNFSDVGISYQLFKGAVAIGSPVPGASTGIDFGFISVGGTYKVVATNTTTGCKNTMAGTVTVNVNPLPSVYVVSATSSSYCAGGSGVSVLLSSSNTGINYQLYNGSAPVGGLVAGTVLPLNLGLQTVAGTYTVKAINAITGCSASMVGSAPVSIDPLPLAYTVTGGGNYCTGGAGVHVGITGSASGIQYQLIISGVPAGAPVAGTGSALDFGLQTASGIYTVAASNTRTTCSNNMAGSVTVNTSTPPTAYTVTGGGSYCDGGSGRVVGLNASDLGVNYQLYLGSSPAGASYTGTGGAINFGLQTSAGTYKVIATNAATSCTNTMAGTVAINVNPAPPQYTVYGGGGYCTGTTGLHVRLSGSDIGVNYQLYNGTTPLGASVTGTGTALDMGMQTAGVYTIVAANGATACTSNMLGSTTISLNPLPVAYTVTGGGNYCIGGTGVHIGMSMSAIGVSYQVYNGATATGAPVAGAGMAIDLGTFAAAGVYKVVATNSTTGCNNNMTGTVTVTATAPVTPAVTISTGTGDTVCNGMLTMFTATAAHGGTAPAYLWKVNGVNAATGSTYRFAPANGDVVTAILTSNAACATPATVSSNMNMTVLPVDVPSAIITANPGSILCPGVAAEFTAATVAGGSSPSFTWYKNNLPVSHSVTYSYMPVDGDVIMMVLKSNARCRVSDTSFSNNITMTVDGAQPAVTIEAHPGNTIAPGQNDTLVAVIAHGGWAPSYQWSLNGKELKGATSPVLISDQFVNNDVVTCTVVPDKVCNGSTVFNSVVINITTVGVRQVNGAASGIKVIPNPTTGQFQVKGALANVKDAEVNLDVTDMLGQTVYKNTIVVHNGNINEAVSLSNSLANGMYMLTLRSGNDVINFHIILQH